MIRGYYSAASAMVANFLRQQVVANNLANVNTPGYKAEAAPLLASRELPTVGDFGSILSLSGRPSPKQWFIGTVGTGALVDASVPLMKQGDLQQTERELDLAIDGEGFFTLQTPTGQTLYTRSGTFQRDGAGQLVTPEGFRVMGDDGPLTLPIGDVLIDDAGVVTVGDEAVGKLKLASFDPMTNFRKVGNNVYVPEDPLVTAFDAVDLTVKQGFLEGSNVDTTEAMTEMMSIMRSYEAAQRLLQMQDQALDRTVNELGRI
jgi:flagellar basal-body rod protein FlgF